jgi:hypothetical protein
MLLLDLANLARLLAGYHQAGTENGPLGCRKKVLIRR